MKIKTKLLLAFIIVPLLGLAFLFPYSKLSLVGKCLAVNDIQACMDCSPGSPGCFQPGVWPHGWFDCDPTASNCRWFPLVPANAHCNANPPGFNGMECENTCPGGNNGEGASRWGRWWGTSTGQCPSCRNPTFICNNVPPPPPCTPNYQCQVDAAVGLKTGWYVDVNACPGSVNQCRPTPGNTCPVDGNYSACIGGLYYWYDWACTRQSAGCLSVSGHIFNDTNKDRSWQNPGEAGVGAGTVTIGGNTVAVQPDGSYTVGGLVPGSYTVSYNGVPVGYKVIWPSNGPPPQYALSVGPGACPVAPNPVSPDASCDAANSVINLNFGITDSSPWYQTADGDVRIDNGVSDVLAQSPNAACLGSGGQPSYSITHYGSTPGVVFSGDVPYNFGPAPRSVSSAGWIAGGGSYAEVFPANGALSTSYTTLYNQAQKAGIALIPLSSQAGCTTPAVACNLGSNLPKGIYWANGDVKLSLQNNSFNPTNNYIFLVHGDLTILSNVSLTNRATVLFSAFHDIHVAQAVGGAPACPMSGPQLQGFFSADHDFIVDGKGSNSDCVGIPADNALGVEGAIVVNAAGAGGAFTNNRDLCGGNTQFPAVAIRPSLTTLLNAPSFLLKRSTVSQEVAP